MGQPAERLARGVGAVFKRRVRGEAEPAGREPLPRQAPDEQRALARLGAQAQPPEGRVRLEVLRAREHGLEAEAERAVKPARGRELDYPRLGHVRGRDARGERAGEAVRARAVEAEQPAAQAVFEAQPALGGGQGPQLRGAALPVQEFKAQPGGPCGRLKAAVYAHAAGA